jgi:hypothetical protein
LVFIPDDQNLIFSDNLYGTMCVSIYLARRDGCIMYLLCLISWWDFFLLSCIYVLDLGYLVRFRRNIIYLPKKQNTQKMGWSNMNIGPKAWSTWRPASITPIHTLANSGKFSQANSTRMKKNAFYLWKLFFYELYKIIIVPFKDVVELRNE